MTCWLTLLFLEIREPDSGPREAQEQPGRMVSHAHDLYLSAVHILARMRRLLRPEVQQVNIAAPGAQQLNVAPATPAPALDAPPRK